MLRFREFLNESLGGMKGIPLDLYKRIRENIGEVFNTDTKMVPIMPAEAANLTDKYMLSTEQAILTYDPNNLKASAKLFMGRDDNVIEIYFIYDNSHLNSRYNSVQQMFQEKTFYKGTTFLITKDRKKYRDKIISRGNQFLDDSGYTDIKYFDYLLKDMKSRMNSILEKKGLEHSVETHSYTLVDNKKAYSKELCILIYAMPSSTVYAPFAGKIIHDEIIWKLHDIIHDNKAVALPGKVRKDLVKVVVQYYKAVEKYLEKLP